MNQNQATNQFHDTKTRLLTFDEVYERTGIKKSSAYSKMAKGLFPRPVKISERSVRWIESDIDDWINQKISPRKPCT